MQLSKNFTLAELTRSEAALRLGIDNTPSKAEIENLRLLCENVLQPIREEFGPVRITSGYRCGKLNKLIGGSINSDHCVGRAADIEAPLVTHKMLAEWIKANLQFRQCILEFPPDGWVHVSYDKNAPKKQCLTARKDGAKTVYLSGLVV